MCRYPPGVFFDEGVARAGHRLVDSEGSRDRPGEDTLPRSEFAPEADDVSGVEVAGDTAIS